MAAASSPTVVPVNIALVGDGAVGKTAIGRRFERGEAPALSEGEQALIQVWDASGEALYAGAGQAGSPASNYLHAAHAVVLVYDVGQAGSFRNLETWWLGALYRTFLGSPGESGYDPADPRLPLMVLAANKCDLGQARVVKPARHDQLAADHGLLSYSISARTGDGVNVCLLETALAVLGFASEEPAAAPLAARRALSAARSLSGLSGQPVSPSASTLIDVASHDEDRPKNPLVEMLRCEIL